jgi:hypothetical protein
VYVDGGFFSTFYGMDRRDTADSSGIPWYRYYEFKRIIPIVESKASEPSTVPPVRDRPSK